MECDAAYSMHRELVECMLTTPYRVSDDPLPTQLTTAGGPPSPPPKRSPSSVPKLKPELLSPNAAALRASFSAWVNFLVEVVAGLGSAALVLLGVENISSSSSSEPKRAPVLDGVAACVCVCAHVWYCDTECN